MTSIERSLYYVISLHKGLTIKYGRYILFKNMNLERRSRVTFKEYQGITEQKKQKVAVIGAGVIGLSTAILAQEAGYNVTIYSDKQTTETTSMKAAASFKPHEVVYNELAHRMVELSWDEFEKIERSENYLTTGVRKHTHWEASSTPKDLADYLVVMEDFEVHERPNVPGGYAFGWKYKTFFVDTPIYLNWLTKKFQANDGRLVLLAEKFKNQEQFQEIPADIIFNCTGLGAKELMNDENIHPIKGQIAVVDPVPNMDWSISADGFYVYPRLKDTVLGGTTEWGVESENVENGAIHLIIRGNKRILPKLSIDDVKHSYAGLRPYREGTIRVEAEEIDSKRVIHNYGHGGSGITMSWGSAKIALNLI